MKKITLLLSLLLMITACNNNTTITAKNLMAGINRNDITPIVIDNSQESGVDKATEITNFSLNIFKKILNNENTLISPLSIISALSMTANGAEKETLSQMEEVFGADINGLNEYLHKTKIGVDERGTKAGAVTAVEMVTECAAPAEPRIVNLDRPFFFMIMDSDFNMPIFMGALNDVT